MKVSGNFVSRVLLSVVLVLGAITAALAQSATITTLGVSSNTFSAGAPVTLTATVTAGATPVTVGQVLFCNADAPRCEDSAILGSAWITRSGTAILRRTFGGLASFNVEAVFLGTKSYQTSTSPTQTLTGPKLLTTTTIGATGGSGNYVLTAIVTANNAVAPTGTVEFDDTNTDSQLAAPTVGTPVFTSSYSSTAGPAASTANQVIVAGDFNNDGLLDYAIANQGSTSNALVMLNNGSGTFSQNATTYSVGSFPQGAVVADFNGDGNLDIAFAGGSGLTVLLGKGDGTFTSVTAPDLMYAAGIAVGDFNGDGIPDLAVSNNVSANYVVTILLGNGDGTFVTGSSVSVPSWSVSPEGLIAMDFNHDGKTDLAVTSANTDETDGSASYQVTILLANGDGTFTKGQSYATGASDTSIAGGDFNGDGIPDLAIANRYDDTVTILLGSGDGTFTTVAPIPTDSGPFAIISGDFNSDGNIDLATANYDGSTVTVLLGNGDGTFTVSSPIATGSSPDGIVTGDFNGDGLPDFITANYLSSSSSVLLQSVSTTTTITTGPLSVADSDQVYAKYDGDSNYISSQSSAAAVSTIPAPPSTVASQTITFPNPGPLTYGSGPVTLTATATSGLPVTYWIVQGPGSLSGNTLTATAGGDIIVEADQAGNTNYNPAAPVRITIGVSGVEIQQETTSTTVTAGQSATIALSLTPAHGFTGTLDFTCSVPATMTGASCSASPVQVTSGVPVIANVTLKTTGLQAAAVRWRHWNEFPASLAFGIIILGGMGRKKLKRRMLIAGLLIVLVVLTMGLISCGSTSGSSSSSEAGNRTGTNAAATPTGTYSLTLVATSGRASYTVTLPVTVQ